MIDEVASGGDVDRVVDAFLLTVDEDETFFHVVGVGAAVVVVDMSKSTKLFDDVGVFADDFAVAEVVVGEIVVVVVVATAAAVASVVAAALVCAIDAACAARRARSASSLSGARASNAAMPGSNTTSTVERAPPPRCRHVSASCTSRHTNARVCDTANRNLCIHALSTINFTQAPTFDCRR
jgi:hypothetical protein